MFVLNDKRYEEVDWETLDNIFDKTLGNHGGIEIESNKEQTHFKDQSCIEQKSPHCPFGNNCSQIHNPCQVFKPNQGN